MRNKQQIDYENNEAILAKFSCHLVVGEPNNKYMLRPQRQRC